jgi:type I restriction enzyme S subunit
MPLASITLADECELITKGTTPSTLGLRHQDHGIPFIRAQNLVDGTVSVEADPLFIDQKTHDLLRRSKIKPSDILLSIAGTIGRAAIVPANAEEMNCNQAVAIIRPSSGIDRRFLLHWLSSRDAVTQVTKGKVTGTISNLSLGQIGNLKIPLPPPDEQRRIASILDKADALRRKSKRALDLLNNLSQSIFLDMFGDLVETRTLARGTISDWVADFDTGKNLAPDPDARQADGYRVLKVSAVTTGVFLPSEAKPLPPAYKPPTSHVVRQGDLLFSRANTTELIGATAYVESPYDKLVLPDKIWRFVWRDKNAPNPRFIHALFSTPSFRRELSKRATGTSGSMKNISKAKVLGLEVALPNRDQQDRFAERQQALQSIKSAAIAQSATLDGQFSSLQSRAFSGHL